MEYYVELKLRNDDHNGGFSNKLTLCGSKSTSDLVKVSENETTIIYENPKKHLVTLKMKQYGDTTEVSTTLDNQGEETVTLELLSSFAIKGIQADKVHRMQSFWSAEGKLRQRHG